VGQEVNVGRGGERRYGQADGAHDEADERQAVAERGAQRASQKPCVMGPPRSL
jgi:hypothetical protein